MDAPSPNDPYISAVVPVFNEVDSLPQLHRELTEGLQRTGREYEILFINDGSRDGTTEKLDELAVLDPHVGVIHFRQNFGKSPALNAAFERVRGQIVLTLDADLQDDPKMIPDFVERIEAGADLVSGWKQRRHDPIGKTMPSKIFNGVVRWVSGVPLRDFNCGYKAYRVECIRELSVYGGFHRFLPVLAGDRGFRIEELVVQHRAREHGVSKFGIKRFFDGFLDLLTVLMVTRFRTRPVHFFGIWGIISGAFGLSILLYMTVLWLLDEPIGTRPLLQLGVLLTLTAIQLIGLGLVGELLVRTTITSREVFSIKRTSGILADPSAGLHAPPRTKALVGTPTALAEMAAVSGSASESESESGSESESESVPVAAQAPAPPPAAAPAPSSATVSPSSRTLMPGSSPAEGLRDRLAATRPKQPGGAPPPPPPKPKQTG